MIENATLKLSDLLWIAGLITALIAAYKAISSINPVSTLKGRVDRHDILLQNDKAMLEKHDREIEEMRCASENDRKALISAIQSLMRYEINGDKDQLNIAQSKLDDYLAGGNKHV